MLAWLGSDDDDSPRETLRGAGSQDEYQGEINGPLRRPAVWPSSQLRGPYPSPSNIAIPFNGLPGPNFQLTEFLAALSESHPAVTVYSKYNPLTVQLLVASLSLDQCYNSQITIMTRMARGLECRARFVE